MPRNPQEDSFDDTTCITCGKPLPPNPHPHDPAFGGYCRTCEPRTPGWSRPRGYYSEPGIVGRRVIWYEATGEFRPPKRGEFYLSGAIPQVWSAHNDLSTPFWIMRTVSSPPDEIEHQGFRYRLMGAVPYVLRKEGS